MASTPHQGPRDFAETTSDVFQKAIADPKEAKLPTDDGKDPAAVSLGRKGGLKGGKARADALTSERRSEIAKRAAEARWSAKESGNA